MVKHGENGWMVDVEDFGIACPLYSSGACLGTGSPDANIEKRARNGGGEYLRKPASTMVRVYEGVCGDSLTASPAAMLRKFIDFFKYRLPGTFQAVIRLRDFFLIRIPGWLNILRIRKIDSGISVFYLTTNFPNRPTTRGEHAHGGSVKLTYLAEAFPHAYPAANLAYIVTSVGHPMQKEILERAKRTGLKFVVNHDGVAFPGMGWRSIY